jgi:hypothetical protein
MTKNYTTSSNYYESPARSTGVDEELPSFESETYTYGEESTNDGSVSSPYHGNQSYLSSPNPSQLEHISEHNSCSSVQYVHDATDTVRDVHHALLYLLSNPEEFEQLVHRHRQKHINSTMSEWQEEAFDEDDDYTDDDSRVNPCNSSLEEPSFLSKRLEDKTVAKISSRQEALLPYLIFAPDAEVVLPQAHTSSQLFGIEQNDGIELEAASGIIPLSRLFLRWLALMPGGDHRHIIDPPGLVVMRIAGGRYRVTAAHRCVWTWTNHFDPEAIFPSLNDESFEHSKELYHDSSTSSKIQLGDLVTMTIVDVFETDSDGKLLSYCPTFDNRSVKKTNPASELIDLQKTKVSKTILELRQTKAYHQIEKNASKFLQMAGHVAKSAAVNVGSAVKGQITKQRSVTPSAASGSTPQRETIPITSVAKVMSV